jgi:hypothetical protein
VVEAPYSPRATHRKLMPRRELLPGQCRRYRHLGAPRQSSSHPVRSRSVSRPSPAPKPDGSAALRATREFGHFGALTASLKRGRDSRPLGTTFKVRVESRASKVSLGGSVPSWLALWTDRAGPLLRFPPPPRATLKTVTHSVTMLHIVRHMSVTVSHKTNLPAVRVIMTGRVSLCSR